MPFLAANTIAVQHFFAVFQHFPEWWWNQLSTAYTILPRLTLDEDVIDTPALNNKEPRLIFCKGDKESESDRLSSEVETPDGGVEKQNQTLTRSQLRLRVKGGGIGTWLWRYVI